MADTTVNMKVKVTADTSQADSAAERSAKKLKAAYEAERRGAISQARSASQDSGISRGLGGQTGAEGRDFAKQAQGMGGLVHVYATFAANIFALSAAFGALSKAADTTNMVKGLDQLGITSGRALGSLSKQMVMVTDSAINLRDAMTATAQASAGGMTNQSILRMANVAKQASQALGVAMPDALSRISRGITKLEPELLDEIGIMVRVDKSSQDYARTIGKTASALTDFEKRQGFANAVLEQGEKKFGSIKIDANPYAKILASMENLAQKGLELVNTVLTPILNILSSSPTTLALAMAGVASVLLKQALPAIGAFRESLNESARLAKDFAVNRAAEARKGYEEAYKNAKNAASIKAKAEFDIAKQAADDLAEAKVAKVIATEEKIKKLRESSKKGTATYDILSKTDLNDITEADIKRLELNAKQQKGKAAELQAGYAKDLRAWKAEELAYEKEIIAAQAKKEAALEKYNKSAEQAAREQIAQQGVLSTIKQNQILADRAILSATSKSIVATAANKAATEGLGAAWKEALASVNTAKAEQGMGKLQGMWTMTKVGIVSATGAISTFMNFMGPWMAIIGLATAAFALIDSWASTAKKEIEAFDNSLTSVTDTTKLLSDVSNDLWSKGSSDWLSAESMNARANAMVGLSESISTTIKNLEKIEVASSGWDNFWDGLLWTDSRTQKASKAIGKGIAEAIDLAPDSEAKTEYVKKLEGIIGKFDKKKLTNLDVSKEKLKELAEADKAFSTAQANSAEVASKGTKALAELDKVYNNLKVSLTPTDNMFKFGDALLGVSSAMRGLSKDTELAFQELVRLVNTPGDLAKFGKFGESLAKQKDVLNEINDRYNTQAKALKNLKTQMEAIRSIPTQGITSANTRSTGKVQFNKVSEIGLGDSRQEQLKETIKSLEDAQTKALNDKKKFTDKITEVEITSLKAGLDAISASFNATLAAGALKVQSTLASAIAGEGGIKAREAVALKEVDLRLQSNNIMVKLIKAQEIAAIAIERNTLTTEKSLVQGELNTGTSVQTNRTKLEKLTKSIEQLDFAEGILKGGNTFSKYKEAANGTDSQKAGAERVKSTAYVLMNAEAQAGAAEFEKTSIRIKATLDIIAERSGQEIKKITDNIAKLDSEIKSLEGVAKSSNSLVFEDMLEQKTSLKFAEEKLALEKEDVAIAEKYSKIMSELRDPAALKNALDGQLTETKALKSKKDTLERSIELRTAENIANRISKENSIALLSISKQSLAMEQENSSSELKLQYLKNELEYKNTIGTVTSEQYIKEKSLLDIKSGQIAKDAEINKLTTERNSSLANASKDFQTSFSKLSPEDKLETSAARVQLEKEYRDTVFDILAKEEFGKSQAESRLKLLTDTTQKQAEYNELVAKQNEQLKEAQLLTESLTSIFGDIGTNIGKASEAILKLAQDDQKYAAAKVALEKELADAKLQTTQAETPTEITAGLQKQAEIEKKLEKNKQDSTKSELDGVSKAAAASKKLFGEKTAAYKVLTAVEKAAAAQSAIIRAKELAETIASLPAKIGAAIATMGAQSGWGAFAGAAALVALISSFTGESGGDVPAAPSTADIQKAQLTGQSYNSSGKLVSDGSGALGDPSANVKGIQDSIDTLGKVFFNHMGNKSSTLLSSLLAIQYNTGRTVAALLMSNTGVSSGLAGAGDFKLPESSSTSIGDQYANNVPVFINTILTGVVGTLLGPKGVGDILTSLLPGLGSKIYSSMDSQYLNFKGNLGTGTATGDISTTVSTQHDLPFGKSYKEVATYVDKLGSDVLDPIGVLLKSFSTSMRTIGTSLGISTQKIEEAATKDIDLSINIAGLKGQEIINAFSAGLTKRMNTALSEMAPWIKSFSKVDEEVTATATRLIKDSETVDYGLKMVGKSVDGVATSVFKLNLLGQEILISTTTDTIENKIRKQQNIIQNFGGDADKFASAMDAYYNALFSDSEKATFMFNSVQDSLHDLGIFGINTNEQLKGLIASTDPTTKLFADLVKLVPEFTSATAAQLAISKKLADARLNQDIEILRAQGKSEEALRLTRQKELDSLDETLRPRQLYLYSLQDEAAAKEKIAKATDLVIRYFDTINDKESSLFLKRQKELASLDASLRYLQKRIYAVEDARSAAQNALAVLQKSVNAQKKIVQTASTDARNLINKIESILSTLKSSVDELYKSVTSTAKMKAEQSIKFIDAAIATAVVSGALPDSEALSDAITSAKEGVQESNFRTKEEADFARLVLAGKLDKLRSLASTQLDSTKTAEETAQAQLENLDSLVETAQEQLDAANRTNTAILSLTDAISNFNNSITGLNTAMNPSTTTVGRFDPGRAKSIKDYILTLEWGNPATEQASAYSVYGAALQYGVHQDEIANAMDLKYQDVVDFFAAYGIPKFDVGTNYVPNDMLAMVHQGEQIVPKAYNNATANSELVKEIQALRAEVASLRQTTEIAGAYTKKTSDTLTRVTLGGEAMQTQAA